MKESIYSILVILKGIKSSEKFFLKLVELSKLLGIHKNIISLFIFKYLIHEVREVFVVDPEDFEYPSRITR